MFMGVGCLASGLFCGLRVYCGDRAAGATEKKYADVRGARLSDGTKENALEKKASPIPRQTKAGTREKRNAIMVRGRPMPALLFFAVIHFSCQLYFPRRRKLNAGGGRRFGEQCSQRFPNNLQPKRLDRPWLFTRW
jgi:hypothetical protein